MIGTAMIPIKRKANGPRLDDTDGGRLEGVGRHNCSTREIPAELDDAIHLGTYEMRVGANPRARDDGAGFGRPSKALSNQVGEGWAFRLGVDRQEQRPQARVAGGGAVTAIRHTPSAIAFWPTFTRMWLSRRRDGPSAAHCQYAVLFYFQAVNILLRIMYAHVMGGTFNASTNIGFLIDHSTQCQN